MRSPSPATAAAPQESPAAGDGDPEQGGGILGPCLSPASFRIPDYLVVSAWQEHAPFAGWLVESHRPDCLVELGTHTGYSYMAFCEAVRAGGLTTRCYAVDTWQGDEHAGFYGDEVLDQLKAYHDPRFSGFSHLIRSTFDSAVGQFPDRSIDLLHIDGRHFYEDGSSRCSRPPATPRPPTRSAWPMPVSANRSATGGRRWSHCVLPCPNGRAEVAEPRTGRSRGARPPWEYGLRQRWPVLRRRWSGANARRGGAESNPRPASARAPAEH